MYKYSYPISIAFIISLGGFLYGFDASVISGVIGYVSSEFELTPVQQGWVVSAPTFSAMFSMLMAGVCSVRMGCKKILIYVAFLYALSALGSALATSYELLVISRMIGGLAFGAALILAPVYIAEIAPSEQRGKLVAIQQLNLVIGLSVAYFSNYLFQMAFDGGVSFLNESNVWRWMLGIELLPALLFFMLLFFVPNSPRWLLLMGREEEAFIVLKKIFSSRRAETEKNEILKSLKEEELTQKTPLRSLFAKRMRLIMTIALVIGIVQMITGINAIFYYANTIFEQSGIGRNAAFTQAVMVGIVFVFFTIIAMLTIDRFGRKPLLLIGLSGIIISLGITAFSFNNATYRLDSESLIRLKDNVDMSRLVYLKGREFDNDIDYKKELIEIFGEAEYHNYQNEFIKEAIHIDSKLVLIGILGFIASFAMSLGPVMWVLLAEIFPLKMKGLGIAFIGFINSLTSTVVTLVFPWQLENIGSALTFMIYMLFAVVGLILLTVLLPETKGKSLEQLEMQLINF